MGHDSLQFVFPDAHECLGKPFVIHADRGIIEDNAMLCMLQNMPICSEGKLSYSIIRKDDIAHFLQCDT